MQDREIFESSMKQTITVGVKASGDCFLTLQKYMKEPLKMIKYCVYITIDRDINEPKFFATYEEAYKVMEDLLIEEIFKCGREDEFLYKDFKKLINMEDAESNGELRIGSHHMWSNLDDDYDIDVKIYKLDMVTLEFLDVSNDTQ